MIWWILFFASAGFLIWKRLPVWRRISAELALEEAAAVPRRRRSLVDPTHLTMTASPASVRTAARGIDPSAASAVEEKVSVVLRRQIPIRFDEPPRSWIGGLPMMPDGLEWPLGTSHEKPREGERPLNFVAQIACADLPLDLWGGLGARTGWLLFFLDPNLGYDHDGRSFRVLHSPELGKERQPPIGLPPVYDGVYTGPDYKSYLSLDEVPSVWRRWPVDLVTVPNQAVVEQQRTLVTPPDFSSTLYEGAKVADETMRSARVEPFSWRCLLVGLRRGLQALTAPAQPRSGASRLRERLMEPGAVADIVPSLDRFEEEFRAGSGAMLEETESRDLEDGERARRERMRAYAAERRHRRDRIAALIEANPSAGALLARIDEARTARDRWKSEASERLRDLVVRTEGHPLDTPLDPAEWHSVREQLEQDCNVGWELAWGRSDTGRTPVTLEERRVCLYDFVRKAIEEGSRQLAADYYVDARMRPMLPDHVVQLMEPYWRQLYDNRPHRMGGYHDGLQSDAEIGPQKDVLLLQLASDDAMQWVWGDAGAYYVFIDTKRLEAGDFQAIQPQLECH